MTVLMVMVVVGLCLVLPAIGLAGRILWRWRTWTRVDAKVFRITKDKAAKMTYLVDGRQRTAVNRWAFGAAVGDAGVVRHDPKQPLRHEIDRPVWRAVCLLALALVASAGVGFIIAGTQSGSLWNDSLDVPWFVWIGLGLVALAIHQRRRRVWRQADGTVTGLREDKVEDTDGSISVTYRVAYEFVDLTGTNRTRRPRHGPAATRRARPCRFDMTLTTPR